DSIAAEREQLKPIRDAADVIIDTSSLTLSALKEKLAHAISGIADERMMSVSVVAFGYKYGVPLDADLVFDVRFLPNPNYVPDLQPLTGDHPAVIDYLNKSPEVQAFKEQFVHFLDFLLPQFLREGKSHLTIGIGCTGGRHRSVYIANELSRHLESQRMKVFVERRDSQR
ncbi:MAG TPA: RNase adapter RapZ, partial [Candidatus Eremiobacteraceae bacterium]|nr:RNase adapter RapZ [Candidatus Eremiobacteraceae bacterium]